MRVVTFGEVMLRLCPPGHLRVAQSLPGTLDATFGGGELNVAVSIACQGGHSAFLTASPENTITDALQREVRRYGVDASLIQRVDRGRFGIYFVETGANQRPGTVTYDRSESSIAVTDATGWNWDRIFESANWFHITGITPAISRTAAASALTAVRAASARGVRVSCDLNYRSKLWNWDADATRIELAQRTMRELVEHIDVVIANEEDADRSLGIRASDSDIETGQLDTRGYEHVARTIVDQFPRVSQVAITLRQSYSASHNDWGAMLYDAGTDQSHFAPLDEAGRYAPYTIRNIVDRVGAGDSFAGALIFALNTPELSDPAVAVRYATAASCLKHSIYGDFNNVSRDEIEALMHGSGSGRVQR